MRTNPYTFPQLRLPRRQVRVAAQLYTFYGAVSMREIATEYAYSALLCWPDYDVVSSIMRDYVCGCSDHAIAISLGLPERTGARLDLTSESTASPKSGAP